MDNENQGLGIPPANEPKKKKTGCFVKTIGGIVGALVILGIIGAFFGDEEEGGESNGGGGGNDWQYTGAYFDSVFEGFPKDEGVIYQHFPRDVIFLGKVLMPIKVMQATKKGNLVELGEYDRVIWVETKRRYEDDEPLDEGYYIRRGSMEYETALGAEKRVPRYVEVTGSLLKKVQKQIEDEKAAAEAKARAEAEAMAKAKAEHEAAMAKAKAEVAAMHAGTRPGETTTITLPGGVTLEMVWCPPGTFTMGSHRDAYQVTLTKGFWMGKTEVTQAQWESVMGNNPSKNKEDTLPVENVTWNDCQEFCKNTGLQLPTEAQWEYACRAGSTGPYAGTGNLDDMGWYDDNSDRETHPVGTKQPNAWGLYDMHGNVWEWCQGPSSGSSRVARGGSWGNGASICTSAYRNDDYAMDADYYYGFRLVRTLSE
jgi:formylglycine-generating enzyme required for sulfatase activity